MKKRIVSLMMAAVMAAAVLAGCGSSQSGSKLPKNIEIQVPAKAGGNTDLVARALATQVAKDSGSNLVIQNNDGTGVIPMEQVRNEDPDGSTIMFFSSSMLAMTATGVFEHNAEDDYTIIAVGQPTNKVGNVLVVGGDSPYDTIEDLVAAAKEAPGELLFGVGTGSTSHLYTGQFAKAAGIEVKYVDGGSDTEKLTLLVGGSIDACFVNSNQAKQYVESGKAKALACISADEEGGENALIPGCMSLVDLGYDCTFSNLYLVLGPKGMDEEMVTEIHDYFESAAANQDVIDILQPADLDMRFVDAEEGIELVSAQQAEFNEVAEILGLSL